MSQTKFLESIYFHFIGDVVNVHAHRSLCAHVKGNENVAPAKFPIVVDLVVLNISKNVYFRIKSIDPCTDVFVIAKISFTADGNTSEWNWCLFLGVDTLMFFY